MPDKSGTPSLAQTVVRLGVILCGLLFIRMVLWAIPLFSSLAIPGTGVSARDLLGAVVSGISIWLVLQFSEQAEPEVDRTVPSIPGAGRLARLAAALACAAYGYQAFQPVALPLLGSLQWVYQVAALFLIVWLLAAVGLRIHAMSDDISRWFVAAYGRAPAGPPPGIGAVCPACLARNLLGAKFCASCGAALAKPEEPKARPCPNCSTKVQEGSLYCPKCGKTGF